MYIPTHIHTPLPSPQAQDLGHRIASVVRGYLTDNPGVGSTDVTQAFMVARQLLRADLGGVGQRAAILVVTGIIGLLFFILAATLYLGGGFDARFPAIILVIAVMVIAALVALATRRRV